MKKTEILGLPIYDKPTEDKFKLDDWNEGNLNLENNIKNINTQLAENTEYITNNAINVKAPFNNLLSAKGDGLTDDTEAIQSIIYYAFNNKISRVYIPTGTYKITQLKLPRGIKLIGDGIHSTFLSAISSTDMIVLYDETSAYCKVQDMSILGNNIANRGIYAFKRIYTLLYLDNSFQVENVFIKGCNVAGVQLGQNGTASIMECRLTNVTVNQCNGIGIYLTQKCTDSYFINCTGATSLQGGFKIEGFNLKFLNCKTYFNGSVANPFSGYIINNCSINAFTNCEAQDNYKYGFEVINSQNIGFKNIICDRNGNGGLDSNGDFVAPTTPLYSGIYLESCRRINVDGEFMDSNYLTLQKHTQLSAIALKSCNYINIHAQADTMPYFIYDVDKNNHAIEELFNSSRYYDITPSMSAIITTTVNGITFSKINDSTFLVNGTATADAKLNLFGAWGNTNNVISVPSNSRLKVGVVIDNEPSGKVFLTVVKGGSTIITSANQDYYENVKTGYQINQLELKVSSGVTLSNIIIQPKIMIKQMTLKGQYD